MNPEYADVAVAVMEWSGSPGEKVNPRAERYGPPSDGA